MPSDTKTIYVFADWYPMESARLIGTLYTEISKGKEIISFEYEKEWLKTNDVQILDPELQFYEGRQYLPDEKVNFGIFMDSAPDNWGQLLMKRKEAAIARREKRKERRLYESDYLLGVFDGHRMGALRYKLDMDGPYINDDTHLATPPWTQIRQLEEICQRLDDEDFAESPDYIQWLIMLVNPGASLGGARPKVSVVDSDGHLWIAKFPSSGDKGDTGCWENISYEMAIDAGIKMAESRAQKFYSSNHTFLTKRFDRISNQKRIHFASAMTLLGHVDHPESASYLEIVDFITSYGGNVRRDLEELWRRIVFSICISNTDDHLRNHGFLLTPQGWNLSPAFDLNPKEDGTGLQLNISENENSLDLDLALSQREHFRLNKENALEIIKKVRSAVANWDKIATKYGVSKPNQKDKAPAFTRTYSWEVPE